MKIFNFLRKNLISFLVVALSVVMFFSVAAFCWFAQSDGFSTNFKSSTATAYFAGGDGSSEKPYQIKDPVHLYNLAWLQYLGYFNLRSGFNNGRAQSYFKLTADIDMSGYTLPPIGTEKYPFIGNFNGDGFAVTKLTVSNGFKDFNGKIYPVNAVFDKKENDGILYYFSAETPTTSAASFLGMFGVTGNYNNAVTADYTDTVRPVTDKLAEGTVPAKNEFYMSEMSVEGFYLDYVKVKSYANTALVGFVAGYVAGDVKNAGVYQSRIEFANAATAKTGDSISAYGLVGNYDSNSVAWEDDPDSTGGDGGWGGSIDMRTLNRRLNYMYSSGTLTESNVYREYSVGTVVNNGYEFSMSGRYTANSFYDDSYKQEFYWLGEYDSTMYIYENTVVPLAVNTDAMKITSIDPNDTNNFDEEITTNSLKNYYGGTTTVSLHSNSKYKVNTPEVVAKNNTGYLVGYGATPSTTNSKIRAGVRLLASGSYGGVYKSFGETGTFNNADGSNITYDSSRFALFTIKNGTTYWIKDKNNTAFAENATLSGHSSISSSEFTEYDTVRTKFDDSMSGSKTLHGFHFEKLLPTTTTALTDSFKIKRDVQLYVKKDGKYQLETYNDYQLVKGGLNFHVNETGYITAILSSVYNTSYKHSLFDLFEVTRDSNNKITGFTRIEKIYSNGKDITYTPTDGYTEVFDITALSKNRVLEPNAAYYFELPVKSGDYVIGCATDSEAYNAYLMYLDIGMNGDSGTQQHAVSMVDFVNYCDTPTLKQYIAANNGKYPQFDDITAKISAVTAGAYVSFRRKSTAGATFPESKSLLGYLSNGLTIGFTPTGGGKDDPEAEIAWQNRG